MHHITAECDSFIVDTYRSGTTHKFYAGAITFRKRKKIDILHWKKEFASQEAANNFVRAQFHKLELKEAENEEVVRRRAK